MVRVAADKLPYNPSTSIDYINPCRSSAFFQASLAILLAQALATPLASFLIDKYNPWVPIAVGAMGGLVASFSAILVPETIQRAPRPTLLPPPTAEEDSSHDPAPASTFLAHLYIQPKMYESVRFIFQSPSVLILIGAFFVGGLSNSSASIIIQYASKKYGWSLGKAGYIVTLRTVVNIVVLFGVLPFLAWSLQHWFHLPSLSRDLWLARLTILFVPAGFLIMAFSQNAIVMAAGLLTTAIGSGVYPLVRSIGTSLVQPDEIARLYAAMGLLEGLGSLISGPLIAATFGVGLELGGVWLGLPFLVAASLTAITAFLIWIITLGPKGVPRE